MEFAAARARQRDEDAAQTTLAWQIGKWTGLAMIGKLPPLDEVLEKLEPAQPVKQTRRQFATMARMMAASYGHTFTKRVH